MTDNRFGRLFTDKEFQIDRQSEAYALHNSGALGDKKTRLQREEDIDSVNGSDADDQPKGRDLNKLFSGKGGDDNDSEDD